jgi:hypothetical protein
VNRKRKEILRKMLTKSQSGTYTRTVWVVIIITPWRKVHLEKLIVHSATQNNSRVSWNSEVHHRVHKSLPLFPILSYLNPIPKMHFTPNRLAVQKIHIFFPPCSVLQQSLFMNNSTMKTYGGVEVYLHAFIASALDSSEWLTSRSDHFRRSFCKY